jgi:hypothetical protein
MGFTLASKHAVGAHRSRPAGLRHRLGWRTPAACLLLLLLGWPLSQARGQDLLTAQRDQAVKKCVVGTWVADVARKRLVLNLTGDGRFTLNNVSGRYSVEGDTLKLLAADSEASYQIGLDRNKMDLSGGGLGAPLSFTYQPEATGALRRLFDWSPESVRRKLYRVLLILGVVVLVRLFLSLLQTVSRLVVVSERGPLRFLYRQQKNRALTIHSLVLNLVK